MLRPSLLALAPGALAPLVGGSGRARAVWKALAAGQDPLAPGVLAAAARARLVAACDLERPRVVERVVAGCGTARLVLELARGGRVETVVIPGRGRTTACVSSQIGCARGCGFCLTATLGLVRSLDAGEIVAQVLAARDQAAAAGLPPLRNVVFMGMGEPLDNLAAVTTAIDVVVDGRGLGFAPGHVTLSTVGTDPAAIAAACALPVRMAWSLHAADDGIRRRLVPTARFTAAELRDAFDRALAPRAAVLFVEVTLLDGVNDGEQHARDLATFLRPLAGRVRVNLLPMNPGRDHYRPTPAARAVAFREALRGQGYLAIVRRARGQEAEAACGQLAVRAT